MWMSIELKGATKSDAACLPQAGPPALRAELAGVELTSSDTQALAAFYADAMGHTGDWRGPAWTGALGGRWLKIRDGAGKHLGHAAFAVADDIALSALRARLTAASVIFDEIAAASHFGAAIRLNDPDGNELHFGLAGTAAPSGDLTVPPSRLQHLVFASDDTPAMVRFYCDILGFAASDYVKDDAGELTAAFLRCSREHHSLAIFRAPGKRLDHLCFDVADWAHIRDWADRFADRHIPLRWGPGRHGPGNNLFFFVNDPDGNWLEFSSELEVVEGERPIKLWAHEERTLNSWGAAFMRS
jgi:catechol 2,3-dioxygenase-like lactoylglutathione lyase family enzyme